MSGSKASSPVRISYFNDRSGKPHHLLLLSISCPNDAGVVICRYVLDSEIMSCEVQVAQPTGQKSKGLTMADPANKYHVASPSNGDLWVMYVHPGDIVKAGEELFNVSIMKQEKAVLAPVDGVVKRVLKTADFKENKQMVSVREGELLVELGPVPRICSNEACAQPIPMDNVSFCPYWHPARSSRVAQLCRIMDRMCLLGYDDCNQKLSFLV